MNIKETLLEITEPIGVSGQEEEIREAIDAMRPEGYTSYTDHIGNLIWTSANCRNPTVFTAHMDEIGLMVVDYTDDHKVKFTTVGGFDPRTLPNSQVTFTHGMGVIGLPAPHITKNRDRVIPVDELTIDVGATNREEVESIAAVGDVGVITSTTFTSGDMFFSRNTDNRAGCAVLIETAKELVNSDVMFVYYVREEVGLMGMRAFLKRDMNVKEVINLDVCMSEDFGEGVKIEVKDGGYLADRGMVTKMQAINGNKLLVGMGGTSDHVAAQIYVPTVGLGIPSSYIHSSVSKVNIKDLDDAVNLCVQYTR